MYRVGIIGCGRPYNTEGATGYGMAHLHVQGYRASPDTRIVALADIDLDNARTFQAEHGGERLYADYRDMLAKENLDIVSICTWPHLHAPMVIASAEAGVKAIHCEKPMAPTYGEALAMVRVCEERGVQLTFNHQRRFGAPFRTAKGMLASGTIGDLLRLEATCANMFDWGTHWFDMLNFFADEAEVEWVIAQIDPRGDQRIFGVPVEGQGISLFKYRSGVRGLLLTGRDVVWDAPIRLIGSRGVIELGPSREVPLRYWTEERAGWQVVPLSEGLHGGDYVTRAVLDAIDALKTGREPELSARRALRATELIFATYESSRRRCRVDLPLTIEDSPLLAMLGEGVPQ